MTYKIDDSMAEDIRKASAQGVHTPANNADGIDNALAKKYEELDDETSSLSEDIEDADLNFGGSRH